MEETQVEWLADGFRVRFDVSPLPFEIRPELSVLYAIAGAIVAASLPTMVGALLFVPPALLAWWSSWQRGAALEVTHSHVLVTSPLRSPIRLALQEVREVEVYHHELELTLWGGRRIRITAPASYRRLKWVAGSMRQLRDECQDFALEVAESEEASRVKALLTRRDRTGAG